MFGVAMARRGGVMRVGLIRSYGSPRPPTSTCDLMLPTVFHRPVWGYAAVSNMPDKAVYLLVVEGFADWEPAHAVAELRRHGHYRVESVGLTAAPVHSMGGLTVLPSKIVSEVNPADVAVFILP